MVSVPAPPDERAAITTAVATRNIWPIMSGVLLVVLLASLDQTIVGTAMPRIIAQLNGFDHYAWVAAAYLLTFTVTVPIYGKLSDLLGRKLVFLCGIGLFLLGSILCGAAQSMAQLVVFRGLQGCGAGALIPVATAVVGDLFPPKERGKWQGVTGSVWAFASLVGPALGGWIADNWSWRWIFLVNVPIGVAALAVLLLFMPPLRRHHAAIRIDAVGALLLVAGMAPLLLALSLAGGAYAWTSVPVMALLAGAVLALSAFVLYELRFPEPILAPRLFANRIFSISVVATALIGAAMFSTILFVPLFIQGVSGASATSSGAALTPMLLMAIVGGLVSGQLMSRWGRYRYIALSGLALMLAGLGLLLPLNAQARAGDMLPALLLLGAGLGCGMGLYYIVVQNALPVALLGQTTSALAFFRSVGGLVGIAVLGSLMTARYTAQLHASLPPAVTARVPLSRLPALENPQLLMRADTQTAMKQVLTRLGPDGPRLYATVVHAIKGALTTALHTAFLAELVITLIAFIAVLFLPQIPLRGHDEPVDEQEAEAVPEPLLV